MRLRLALTGTAVAASLAGSHALGPADRAASAGIAEVTTTYGAYPADFDGDGREDFLLSRHSQEGRIYHNDGGRFTEVFAGLLPKADRHNCAWADVQQDGLLDFYCTIGGGEGMAQLKRNELLLQKPGGGFTDVAVAYGVDDSLGRGRAVTFLNANGDAFPDLYVTNVAQPGEPSSMNRLFVNLGGVRFRDSPEFGLNGNRGAGCAIALDFDGDGWQDLLVCGGNRVRLFRNDAGRGFTYASAGLSWHALDAEVADLNRDGRPDLAFVGDSGVYVQFHKPSAAYEAPRIVRRLASVVSLAAGDADGDGDIDLYAVRKTDDRTNNAPDALLLNRGTGKRYAEAVLPQAASGWGESAAALDYDSDQRSDFIVLNGNTFAVKGPVQLITFK